MMGMLLFSRVRTCVARWSSSHGATQAATSLLIAIALSACGGSPDADETAPDAAAAASQDRADASKGDAPGVGASGAAKASVTLQRDTAKLAPSSGAYEIRLFTQNGWPSETFELVPVRGTGYQTVRAVVVLRESKTLSPVAGVQPYCATPVRCEYLPPRGANHAERYTISLSDDSIARLSTAQGMIVISGRYLEVKQPSTVTVTLTVDGQPPVTKRITYLNSPG